MVRLNGRMELRDYVIVVALLIQMLGVLVGGFRYASTMDRQIAVLNAQMSGLTEAINGLAGSFERHLENSENDLRSLRDRVTRIEERTRQDAR